MAIDILEKNPSQFWPKMNEAIKPLQIYIELWNKPRSNDEMIQKASDMARVSEVFYKFVVEEAKAAGVPVLTEVPKNSTGYLRVTSGSTCRRITSKAECEDAAKQLEFSGTEASQVDTPIYPPYCYSISGVSLRFNKNGNSLQRCKNAKMLYNIICICKGKLLYNIIT